MRTNKRGGGIKCYHKNTGAQGGWPPCRGEYVLPGDLSNKVKEIAKKKCAGRCNGLVKRTITPKKVVKPSYVKSLKVTGVGALKNNNRNYYTKIQPKLQSNRKKRTGSKDPTYYKKKIQDFDKFSCRWRRSMNNCLGCTKNDKYCVGDGKFCSKPENKLHCNSNGHVLNNPKAHQAYWTQAPEFIGNTSLRTCSGSKHDFSLGQADIANKCNSLYKKTNSWVYKINHSHNVNKRLKNTKKAQLRSKL